MVLAALVLGLAAVTALLKGKQQLKLRRTRCEIRRRLGPYSLLYATAFVFWFVASSRIAAVLVSLALFGNRLHVSSNS